MGLEGAWCRPSVGEGSRLASERTRVAVGKRVVGKPGGDNTGGDTGAAVGRPGGDNTGAAVGRPGGDNMGVAVGGPGEGSRRPVPVVVAASREVSQAAAAAAGRSTEAPLGVRLAADTAPVGTLASVVQELPGSQRWQRAVPKRGHEGACC